MINSLKNFNYFPQNFPMNFSGKLSAKIIIKSDFVRADGTCALFMQVFLNKKCKRFPLNISCRPADFDKVKQRLKSKSTFANDYNLIIEKSLAELNKIEINYRLSNINLTMDSLINEFVNPNSKTDFLLFWENELINQKLILKPSTLRQQTSALNKVKGYKKTVYFHEIDDDFISKMKGHFKNVEKNSNTTISSLLKNFKKYLHIANKKGIITPTPFSDVQVQSFQGLRTFLEPNEIVKLNDYYDSDFINESHKSILSRFLFSCFTGLRISDIMKMEPDNIIENNLMFVSQKTSKIHRIPLSESAKKFIGQDYIFKDNFTPEYINRELKFIAKITGIRKILTFHVARHTFATNFLLSGGRVEVLQKFLGHSKITETMIYVHIVESISDIQIHNMDDILKPKIKD